MDEQHRSDLSIALTLIAARANRMAAFVYSYVAFPELGTRPTANARTSAIDTADMIESLRTGRATGVAEGKMLPARTEWLYGFIENWESEHDSFCVTDAEIRLREMEYASLPSEIYRELGTMLLDLAKAATTELMKVADPTVVQMFQDANGPSK